ncbi:DUF3592 domain-containing protein [Haloferula sp. BvORR071]|uniref:DUF3592 domain-containing protein n=1 Tax=Haloferula sp. BvORR071 TaxID=1396141 RepID=UPI0022410089|nr:DUF3592 domain-containing protein [Haloferula sp. BvORR071]
MAGPSTASRVYLSFIGLGLALAGGLFFALMWRSFQRARAVEHWPVVPCVILESGVEDRQIDPNSSPEYRFKVSYGYEWEKQPYKGNLVKLWGSGWSSGTAISDAYVKRYPEGSQQECHVNPENPQTAVLEKESKAPGYSLWFPGIFVVGGLGMVVGAWRPRKQAVHVA